MKNAILIARVSTARQEQEGLSLREIQVPMLRKYAKDKNLNIIKEFVFNESASDKIRHKFNEIINFLKTNKKINAIVALKIDRITRNSRDAVIIDSLIQERGLEIHAVSEGLIINKSSRANKFMQWDMLVMLAKNQIHQLRDHAADTRDTKLGNGELPGPAPYGYKNVTLENKSKDVIQDTFKAKIVETIFNDYASESLSMEQIAKKINHQFGTRFTKARIAEILNNPFYYGEIKYDKNLYRHRYETIITKQLFDKVQSIKDRSKKNKRIYAGKPFPYRGLFKCKVCGCSYTAEEKRKTLLNGNVNKHIYYHCTGAKGKHKHSWLAEDQITDQLGKLFKKLKIPPCELEKLQSNMSLHYEKEFNTSQHLASEFKTQYQLYTNRLEKAYEDKLDGRITNSEYDNYGKKYREKQDFYQRKLAEVAKTPQNKKITSDYVLELASKADSLFQGSIVEEKRALINLLLSNLQVNELTIEYDLKKPFDTILLCNERCPYRQIGNRTYRTHR